MIVPPEPPRLFVSHDKDFHWLSALEYGRVGEDQPQGCWHVVSDCCAYLLDAPEGRVVGFRINAFDEFDLDDPEVAEIWEGPRFDAPVLGLTNATAGEIALAARSHFGDRDSLNRAIFGVAVSHQGEEALPHWFHCLESGDAMAHFALGYTLFGLDGFAEAYAHLRHYTEIAPEGAWNWCWYGQAADAHGEVTEARRAYRRAVELDDPREGRETETDAAERLEALEERLAVEAEAARVAVEEAKDGDAAGPRDLPRPDLERPGHIVFDGEALVDLGRRQLDALDRDVAAGLTRGAKPKAYAATDPNEDSVRVLRAHGATVLLLADGHNGESSSRIACDMLAETLAAGPEGIDSEDDLVELLTIIGDEVRAQTQLAGQPESRTTLALAVVHGDRVRWASMGDSLVAIAAPDDTVRRLGTPRHRFLGWPMDEDDVRAALHHGHETLEKDGWLILASDGLTNFVDDPADAIRRATGLALMPQLTDEQLRAALRPKAIRVVDDLIDAACDGGAGDNVAVIALRGTVGTAEEQTGRATVEGTDVGQREAVVAAQRSATEDAGLRSRVEEEGPLRSTQAVDLDPADRFRGCLLGAAVGDALGAGIEHDSLRRIRRRFGPDGLRDPAPAHGRESAITDDTQMTLFTAEALLRTFTRAAERGVPGDAVWQLDQAYARWLRTQGERSKRWADQSEFPSTVERLLSGPDARRGPGRTCIAAMRGSAAGTPDEPTNTSKGCGGVMRVAPIGLMVEDADAAADLGRRAAALTHGHPTGYVAAGAFAELIALLRTGMPLSVALPTVVENLRVMGGEETRDALQRATALARYGDSSPTAEDVQFLGEGWVADEALAIAVFCALSAYSFEHGVLLAVNHGGDSDSTGAICGALLGTMFGAGAIPTRWLDGLEHGAAIAEVADDLFAAGSEDGDAEVFGERWQGRWAAE